MATHTTFVFDAYGTLFDVHSAVARHRALVGPEAERLSQLWRVKQLEYSWVRALMGAYRDFEALTGEALDFAAAQCGGLSAEARRALLGAYQTLDAYADAKPLLARLKAEGKRTAILSNGSPAMLQAAVSSAGLAPLLDAVLSVDGLRTFKTAPAVYALVGEKFGVTPSAVSFQSSNRWDIAGAVQAGFRTVWVNRGGAPDEYADLPPAKTVGSLSEV